MTKKDVPPQLQGQARHLPKAVQTSAPRQLSAAHNTADPAPDTGVLGRVRWFLTKGSKA